MLGQMIWRRWAQALLHLFTLADSRPFSVADWIKSLHHRIGLPHWHILNLNQFLVCVVYQLPALIQQFHLPLLFQYLESDDSDDASSLLGELSLDENKEVRPLADATKM